MGVHYQVAKISGNLKFGVFVSLKSSFKQFFYSKKIVDFVFQFSVINTHFFL